MAEYLGHMATRLPFRNQTVLLGLIAATTYQYKSDTLLHEWLKARGASG